MVTWPLSNKTQPHQHWDLGTQQKNCLRMGTSMSFMPCHTYNLLSSSKHHSLWSQSPAPGSGSTQLHTLGSDHWGETGRACRAETHKMRMVKQKKLRQGYAVDKGFRKKNINMGNYKVLGGHKGRWKVETQQQCSRRALPHLTAHCLASKDSSGVLSGTLCILMLSLVAH